MNIVSLCPYSCVGDILPGKRAENRIVEARVLSTLVKCDYNFWTYLCRCSEVLHVSFVVMLKLSMRHVFRSTKQRGEMAFCLQYRPSHTTTYSRLGFSTFRLPTIGQTFAPSCKDLGYTSFLKRFYKI